MRSARSLEPVAFGASLGDLKTRGFNLEDTRLRDPRKRDLMIAITALATAWASKAAASPIGSRTLERKSHLYCAKSWVRTGLNHVRHMRRTNPIDAIKTRPNYSKPRGVVRCDEPLTTFAPSFTCS